MNRFLLLMLLALSVSSMKANPIDKESAAAFAMEFMKGRGVIGHDRFQLVCQGGRCINGRSAPVKNPYYYVFSNPDDGGFVIVSGEEGTNSILGYSDTAVLDPDNIPENLQAWLDTYAEEIAVWRENASDTLTGRNKVAAFVVDAETDTRHVVAPMLQTHWTQFAPFNLKCFTSDGQQALTGCVAVTLAQVMYYHKYPVQATGQVAAYDSYGALPSTVFEWDKMLPVYTDNGTDTEESRNAVAQLYLYCSRAVQANYGTATTGSYSFYIPNALSSFFGYKNKAIEVFRRNFDIDKWDELIYNEIVHHRPVIYSGVAANGASHSFVCDGYDGQGMFHINWGWGGIADGYFRLQALNSSAMGTAGSSSGSGYSSQQHVIIGISPEKVDDINVGFDGDSGVEMVVLSTCNSSKVDTSAGKTLYYNYSASTGLGSMYIHYRFSRIDPSSAYDIGIGVFKGNEMVSVKSVRSNYDVSYEYSDNWLKLTGLGLNLPNGTYLLKGVNRKTSTSQWTANVSSDLHYIKVVISGGNLAKVVSVNNEPDKNVEVVLAQQWFENKVNPKQVRVWVRNNGPNDFKNLLYMFVDGTLMTQETAYLSPGNEDYVDFFVKVAAGSHQVKLTTDEAGKNIVYSKDDFILSDDRSLPQLEVLDYAILNQGERVIYGTLLDGYMTLKNVTERDYHYPMLFSMMRATTFDEEGRQLYKTYTQAIPVSIKAGETVTVPFSFPLAVGDKFYFNISDSNGRFVNFNKTATVVPGIVTWDDNGCRSAVPVTSTYTVPEDAVAVDFQEVGDLDTLTIQPNSLTNTLYYIRNEAEVPSSLKDRNVVNGYEAVSITLDGAKGFYIPQSFTASNISYSRVPRLASDGVSGWQTISLPFTVEKVESDKAVVDWCRDTDDEKDFWLRRFMGNKGDSIRFDNVDEWIPNEPYIMAVPSAMKDVTMTFSAKDAWVQQTAVCEMVNDDYRFVATTVDKTLDDAYVLNKRGDLFVREQNVGVKAGSAYFLARESLLTPPSSLKFTETMMIGDVNDDGIVNVTDVMCIVDYILGGTPKVFLIERADINGNERVDVTDAMMVVDIILTQ